MEEMIRFIFSGFWTWLGFCVLLVLLFDGIAKVVSAIRATRQITVRDLHASRSIEIKNASRADLKTALGCGDKYTIVEVEDRND